MRYFSKLWPVFLLLSWHTGFAMPMLNRVKLQLQDEAWVSSDSLASQAKSSRHDSDE
jgi:hypothetical protein